MFANYTTMAKSLSIVHAILIDKFAEHFSHSVLTPNS